MTRIPIDDTAIAIRGDEPMRLNRKWYPALVVVVGILAALGFSYLLALAGEPQSVWFWRDILGVLP